MNNYIELLRNILNNGTDVNSRAGKCRVLTHKSLSFDLKDGFPALTQRFVPFKSVAVELEGFLHGITSKSWFEDRNCKYWSFWANPQEVKKEMCRLNPDNFPISWDVSLPDEDWVKEDIDDLGPLGYSWQLRRFNEPYENGKPVKTPMNYSTLEEGDQLSGLLDTLKNNPSCRRMRVSHINPLQEDQMALPACHDTWKVDVVDGKLNLRFNLRSSDFYLGFPSNIQSYAILTHLLSRHAGVEPGKVTATMDNVHLYHNLLPQCEELLTREEHPLPELEFTDYGDFWNFTHEDVKRAGYKHSGLLTAKVNV